MKKVLKFVLTPFVKLDNFLESFRDRYTGLYVLISMIIKSMFVCVMASGFLELHLQKEILGSINIAESELVLVSLGFGLWSTSIFCAFSDLTGYLSELDGFNEYKRNKSRKL
ncbi:hypothetical protein R9X47_21770 [Wukongibacter baidiensis]|uniref:hypothetical protein n=1 Tax=Wukongibacter baidiensis TaxID=1723361 RepID=UPI003D7FEF73